MQIENQFLTAMFSAKGAELTSLRTKDSSQEYIWQASREHWARHSPILFPIVGKLKNDSYNYLGKSYNLPQHGFARDMIFEVEKHEPTFIQFLLKSNEETLKKYPFEFELRLNYKLAEESIIAGYEVTNTDSKKMFFSIGGHPAFNCPMDADEKRSDYKLVFNKLGDKDIHLIENGLFNGKTKPLPSDGVIQITDSLFDDDALVLKNLQATNVTLASDKKKWLKFHYQGFPYLGLWSKNRKSPFVCIEPWFGLADHENHNGDLSNKEGIQQLGTGKTFKCDYKVEIH